MKTTTDDGTVGSQDGKISTCLECHNLFPTKKGKKYCSMKCKDKAKGRGHDARRVEQQSEKARKWRLVNPNYDRDRMRKIREVYGRNDGVYAKMIEDSFAPIDFKADAIFVCGDWHIPFHHMGLMNWLLDMADDYGVHDLAIPGDFWESDSYSLWPKLGFREAFEKEIEEVTKVLQILVDHFEHIYICRGNHENRVLKQNCGHIGMKQLFNMTGITEGYEVTDDNFLNCTIGNEKWMLAHPVNFRQTKLSVANDLAFKYKRNIVSAHGHFFAQGYDKSGGFYLLDGGGMFDPECLSYLRRVNTTPWVSNGFYLLDESGYIKFDFGRELKHG